MKPIIAYQCEYCGCVKRFKATMENHEKSCLKNPNASNCLLCKNRNDETKHCKISGKKCSKVVSSKCNSFEHI